jgi:hypothetical protein
VLQPDPRPPHLDEIRVDEWMAGCNAFSGQHYWCDFQSSATDELRYAQDLCLRYIKGNLVPPLEAVVVAGTSCIDPAAIRATMAELRRVCNQFIPDDVRRRLWPSAPDWDQDLDTSLTPA